MLPEPGLMGMNNSWGQRKIRPSHMGSNPIHFLKKIKRSIWNAFLWYKIKLWKGDNMHSKNWFELIQKIILTALGYLAGVYL